MYMDLMLIHVISTESILHALRTHSISYFYKRGWLNRQGGLLQFELEMGGLIERSLLERGAK